MSTFVAQDIFSTPPMPDYPLGLFGPQALGTVGPAVPNNVTPTLESQAQGEVPDNGKLSVVVDIGCVLTLSLWCPGSQTWVNPGTGTAFAQTFTTKNMQYFTVYPGTKFFLSSDTASVHAWTNQNQKSRVIKGRVG